jgi:hypothetical protein
MPFMIDHCVVRWGTWKSHIFRSSQCAQVLLCVDVPVRWHLRTDSLFKTLFVHSLHPLSSLALFTHSLHSLSLRFCQMALASDHRLTVQDSLHPLSSLALFAFLSDGTCIRSQTHCSRLSSPTLFTRSLHVYVRWHLHGAFR